MYIYIIILLYLFIAFALHFKDCRWSLISEEYYSTKKYAFSALLTAGKTIPVKRGAGLGQYSFEQYIERLRYVYLYILLLLLYRVIGVTFSQKEELYKKQEVHVVMN